MPEETINLSSYHQTDPSGLGITVHIASCIIAKMQDNQLDKKDAIEKVIGRRLQDDRRSTLMFQHLLYDQDVLEEMSTIPWNPAIEIIPYERQIELLA